MWGLALIEVETDDEATSVRDHDPAVVRDVARGEMHPTLGASLRAAQRA